MTALEIVQSKYPGIPIPILKPFGDLLQIEAGDGLLYDIISKEYYTVVNQHVKWVDYYNPVKDSIQATLLNPKNGTYKTTKNYNWTDYKFWSLPLEVTYDSRIYSGVKINSDLTIDIIIRNFSGVQSLIALYENDIVFSDIDYDLAKGLYTHINAYRKFATQIDAEKNLLEQQARNTVNNYKQQLDDQAAREYADLQAKKIQLLIAIDNDAKSAQRDFQNMLLTAQGLKNQIGGNLV